jgi:16S rRNA (adenine1518-N6/adenine1519-N6)-dimethyltransferase
MTASRQTISFLRRRFDEVGINPITRYGQNFLIDLNLVRLLAETADLNANDVVLEVGTGTGSLTSLMAQRAGRVVTVEIDPQLYILASEELESFANVVMLKQDALRNKNNLDERVLQTVEEQLEEVPNGRFKLAANLPYNIATPILSNLLALEKPPALMAVTIQKELADRIVASPNTKSYGALSVWMQSLCDCQVVRVMAPNVFWPRPKVHSAIIRLQPLDEKRQAIPDVQFFHRFTRSVFLHRRKFLRSGLLGAYKGELTKPLVDEVMGELNFGAETRAEQLDLEQMHGLCEALRVRLTEA